MAYCKQTIRTAEVPLELAAANFDLIPSCQSQAIALAKYLGDSRNGMELCPELLREKWQEILSAAETTRSQITVGFIQETLNSDKPIKGLLNKSKKLRYELIIYLKSASNVRKRVFNSSL